MVFDLSGLQRVIAFVEPPTRTSLGAYNEGYVLRVEGEFVKSELTNQGNCLGDWFIDELTPSDVTGILVWEGKCENSGSACLRDSSGEAWEPRFSGKWRAPTAFELWSLKGWA